MDTHDDAVRHLRGCIRDLAALSALQAMWVGLAARDVLASFLEILGASVRADVCYIAADDPFGGPMIEAASAFGHADPANVAPMITEAFSRMLAAPPRTAVPSPVDGAPIRVIVLPMSITGKTGVVVGARRADFPSDVEMTLFGTAVNHLTTWLQTTHVVAERAHAEAALAATARERKQLEDENDYLRQEVTDTMAFGTIVGQSAALRNVLHQVTMVAQTDATVLVFGESGTGKELVAREIHERGSRAEHPLIKVNCSAIPRELFESEFFGHVRGSFSGALHDRAGRFQLANGGTLFLDEVGDLPLDLQPKLLRVLQEGQYERIGDDVTRQADVRVIAATNRNLAAEAKAGRFREDLFYRLSVFPIELPPLRARKEDLPLLASHMLPLVAKKLNIAEPGVDKNQWELLQDYDWPGNIRELKNLIERAVILSRGGKLQLELVLPDRATVAVAAPARDILTEAQRREHERANIVAALEETGGKIYGDRGAAKLLGIRPSTLASRMKALKVRHTNES